MSVRQAWRETAALFWENPLLWVPVLGADLLSFLLMRLQKLVTHELIRHLLLGPASVFGGGQSLPESSSHAIVIQAASISGLLQWSAHFAQIILYTSALFMTAALVRAIPKRETRIFQSSIQFVRSRWRPIFRVSGAVVGLLALFAISFAALMALAISRYMTHLKMEATYVIILPAFCGIAYLVTPIAMRRVSVTILQALSARSVRDGRVFAALTISSSALLGYCMPYIQ